MNDPLFFAGIWAMASCVVSLILALFSFVAPLGKRRSLQNSLTFSYAILGCITAWALWRVRGEIPSFALAGSAEEAVVGQRALMTLVLLGMALVAHGLLAAIGRLRAGQPGTAFRSLIWAIPSVQIITESGGLLSFYSKAFSADLDSASFHSGYLAMAQNAQSDLGVWIVVAAGIFLASWPFGHLMARASVS